MFFSFCFKEPYRNVGLFIYKKITKLNKNSYNYMKVVNPNLTTHTTKLIPRFEPSISVNFDLKNETTKEVSSITIDTEDLTDGILSITYDYTFTDKTKYEIKLYNSEGVIYRGKAIATTQEPQEYKLTNNLYFYE